MLRNLDSEQNIEWNNKPFITSRSDAENMARAGIQDIRKAFDINNNIDLTSTFEMSQVKMETCFT